MYVSKSTWHLPSFSDTRMSHITLHVVWLIAGRGNKAKSPWGKKSWGSQTQCSGILFQWRYTGCTQPLQQRITERLWSYLPRKFNGDSFRTHKGKATNTTSLASPKCSESQKEKQFFRGWEGGNKPNFAQLGYVKILSKTHHGIKFYQGWFYQPWCCSLFSQYYFRLIL